MTVRCHSCEPWHMLRRATFMPLAASVASASFEHDAGPIVQMSFVLRVLRGPVNHESITLVYVRSSLHPLALSDRNEGSRSICHTRFDE